MTETGIQSSAPTQVAFIIRNAHRDELEKLVKVYRSGYQGMEEYAYTSQGEIRDYLRWLFNGDPNGFLIAEADGEPIGFVSVHTDWWDRRYQRSTAEIHELVVKKEWQGKGVGRALFFAALDYARTQGCDYASLWVGENNQLAREWYQRLRFEEVGIGWGEWVRMVKKLTEDWE